MLFVDCYGTLVERGNATWKNDALIGAIEFFRDKQPDQGLCVWTWGTVREAEEISTRCFGSKEFAAKKDYAGYTTGDIIIDDHPDEWGDYTDSDVRVVTPEQFIQYVADTCGIW